MLGSLETVTTCLGLGLSCLGLATYVGACRSPWPGTQLLLQLCLASCPVSFTYLLSY